MYCTNCGSRLIGNEKYCPHCGIITNKVSSVTTLDKTSSNSKTASIILGVISLVGIFLVIFSPISLILSIIGLILGIKSNKESSNVAGIVMNAIGLFLSLIITAIIALIIYFAFAVGSNIEDKINSWDYNNTFDYSDKF